MQWWLFYHFQPKHVIFVGSIAQDELVLGEEAVRVGIFELGKVNPHTARFVFQIEEAVLFLGEESVDPNSLDSANGRLKIVKICYI